MVTCDCNLTDGQYAGFPHLNVVSIITYVKLLCTTENGKVARLKHYSGWTRYIITKCVVFSNFNYDY